MTLIKRDRNKFFDFSIDKFKKITGLGPTVNLDEGILRLVSFYLKKHTQ